VTRNVAFCLCLIADLPPGGFFVPHLISQFPPVALSSSLTACAASPSLESCASHLRPPPLLPPLWDSAATSQSVRGPVFLRSRRYVVCIQCLTTLLLRRHRHRPATTCGRPNLLPLSGAVLALLLWGARHRHFPLTSPFSRPYLLPSPLLPRVCLSFRRRRVPHTGMSKLAHPTCARPHSSPLCGRLLLPRSPVASVLLSGGPNFLPVMSLPDPVPIGSACVGEGSHCRCRECVIAAFQ
jgi:hypothetical protein